MTTTVSQSATKKTSTEETLLTPRFYTTDFDAVANMDISSQEEELKAMIAEMKTDYNRDHFLPFNSISQLCILSLPPRLSLIALP
jgi:magnesium-protoporphyrin IX monomethyl ester (oxidative) cyclase